MFKSATGTVGPTVRVSSGSMDMAFVVGCKLRHFQVSRFPISLTCELGLVDYRSLCLYASLGLQVTDIPPVIWQCTTVSRQYKLHLIVAIFLP